MNGQWCNVSIAPFCVSINDSVQTMVYTVQKDLQVIKTSISTFGKIKQVKNRIESKCEFW